MGKPEIKRNFAYRDQRHIRFNFHKTPDYMVMDSPTQDADMYLNQIIVADKSRDQRERMLKKIAERLNSLGGSMIEVRKVEGDFRGLNNYTFVTWASSVPLKKDYLLGMFPDVPIRRDKRIYERKKLKLEESVQDVFYGLND